MARRRPVSLAVTLAVAQRSARVMCQCLFLGLSLVCLVCAYLLTVTLRKALHLTWRMTVWLTPRLLGWMRRLSLLVTRFTVNRARRWADDLRVAVPNLMSLMSAHRADHPSTLPRLLMAALPAVAVPLTVLAVAVGLLTSGPSQQTPVSAARLSASDTHEAPAGAGVDRKAEVSRSTHRYPKAASLSAFERETINARVHHRADLMAAHEAKVARQQARREAREQARQEARERAERKAAAKAARLAAAKAKARQERREKKALAAAQAATDAATAESVSTVEPGTLRAQVLAEMLDYGFAADQWPALDRLIMRESSWNPLAQNASSGAYGLPQSLPGSKMASAGADWRTNPITQVRWMFGYISGRYGTPTAALAHSDAVGWY